VDVFGISCLVTAEAIETMERQLVDAARLGPDLMADAVIVAGSPTNIATIAAAAEVELGRMIQRAGSYVDLDRADFVVLGTPIYFDAAGDGDPYGVSRRPKRGGGK
jgi:hypothetical protein